jgi:hypothetical protein
MAGAYKRIEITVETDQLLIIRRSRVVRAWCSACGCDVDMVNLEEANGLSETSRAAWRAGTGVHLLKGSHGTELICLKSWSKSMGMWEIA